MNDGAKLKIVPKITTAKDFAQWWQDKLSDFEKGNPIRLDFYENNIIDYAVCSKVHSSNIEEKQPKYYYKIKTFIGNNKPVFVNGDYKKARNQFLQNILILLSGDK